MTSRIDILVNETQNVETDPVQVSGDMVVFAYGTFGGATIQLEASPNGDAESPEWFAAPEGEYTEKTWNIVSFGEIWIRAVVTDKSGSTNVSLSLRPLISVVEKL